MNSNLALGMSNVKALRESLPYYILITTFFNSTI